MVPDAKRSEHGSRCASLRPLDVPRGRVDDRTPGGEVPEVPANIFSCDEPKLDAILNVNPAASIGLKGEGPDAVPAAKFRVTLRDHPAGRDGKRICCGPQRHDQPVRVNGLDLAQLPRAVFELDGVVAQFHPLAGREPQSLIRAQIGNAQLHAVDVHDGGGDRAVLPGNHHRRGCRAQHHDVPGRKSRES